MTAERFLIVNADDFGRSTGINDGVIRAHESGIVTSASLMVRWPAASEAARYAQRCPELGLGLHVDVGEWTCCAGAWRRRYDVVNTEDAEAVRREVTAQLARFRDLTGVNPTHLDSHHQAHRHEPLRSVLRALAGELDVPLRGETPEIRHCREFHGQTSTGRPLPDAVSAQGLIGLMEELSSDPTEVVCHPAAALDMEGDYQQARLAELDALCDRHVRAAASDLGVTFGTSRHVPLMSLEAREALDRGDAGRALAAARGFAEQHPSYHWAWLWLSRAQRLAEDLAGAVGSLLHARALAPRSTAVARDAKELLDALPEGTPELCDALRCLHVAGIAPAASPSALGAAVRQHLDLGEPEAAWQVIAPAARGTVRVGLLANVAAGLRARGQLTASLDAYTRAIHAAPHDREIAEAREAVRGEIEVLQDRWSGPLLRSRAVSAVPGRVLHVVGRSLPFDQTGYAVRTHYIARAQQAVGLDPHVVTALGFPGASGADVQLREDVFEGVPHHRLMPGTRGPVGLAQRLTLSARRLSELVGRLRPAVLHAASDYRNALVALAVGRAHRVPVVYEVRGFWEETWRAGLGRDGQGAQRYQLLRERERACATDADRVVTLAEVMRGELARRGVPRDRVAVVPNSVDAAVFRPMPRDPALARELRLDPGTVVVGYVSTLSSYEGIDCLLVAITRLVARGLPVCGLIVGDGPERDRLVNLAADLGVRDRVRFVGRVPHDAVVRYYSLIDLFAVPRTADRVSRLVTPLKPLEAMATGKAVIVSDVEALKEMVTDRVTGRVFDTGSADSLALVLESLVQEDSTRKALGAAARKWVVDHRSWSAAGRLYRELYESMQVPVAHEGHFVIGGRC